MKIYNHSTNLELESSSNRLQTLYSSQSYNSFYSIFGRFDITKNDSGSFSLSTCNLEIINYKGPINMIIEEANIKKLDKKTANGNNIFHLQLNTRALLTEPSPNQYEKECVLEMNNSEIFKGDVLIVTRELLSFTCENIKQIKAKIDSAKTPEDAQKIITKDSLKNGFFDSEFYYRNGKLVKFKANGNFELPFNEIISDLNENKNGSISCHNSLGVFI